MSDKRKQPITQRTAPHEYNPFQRPNFEPSARCALGCNPAAYREYADQSINKLCATCAPVPNMTSKAHDIKVVVASDVSDRDGIGVEIYLHDELVVEVFRDDTKQAREVTLHKNDVPLELVEESIAIFRREIPWDFIDYDSTSQT